VTLDIEHRTDGWYYRIADEYMGYLGPYTLEGLSEQFPPFILNYSVDHVQRQSGPTRTA